ncbi:CLUMA_CG018883, isoform A [Clunio marinus]|uniref:CLUMA_CG018883, isoform A n=1 Tax=Clunio marinus TaxID=568069 RepID=A0A1J1J358_9DIPT|nr:CLUMA_CG018883, isoform A [Clunio marinus]
MFGKFLTCSFILSVLITSGWCGCDRDRDVRFQNPIYMNFGAGFFYMQGLTNGQGVVMYKHPDDTRIFGQYTFKDERCRYETVYYYLLNGKFEFTNPYITDERNFNVTNKINFVQNGLGYEIEYNINPKGLGIFHNLGATAERRILPAPAIKDVPAIRPPREIKINFNNIGKQNLKVSFMKTGENYIQFVTKRSGFQSLEGQYTLKTSDKRYHSITYEIPLDNDYIEMLIREYEISTPENFYKTGTLGLIVNGNPMDVKYYVNKSGFHVTDVKQPTGSLIFDLLRPNTQSRPAPVSRPAAAGSSRPVRNRPAPVVPRVLNPSFSRPDLLTGNRSIQPGRK